jgi:hypothetical protein
MYIVIDSKKSLDDFVQKTAKFTKIPPTRLKSSISKGYGFEHITVFEKQLTPASILTPSPELDALYDWINDGMGGSIFFDNEGAVGCTEVHEILPPYPGILPPILEQNNSHDKFLKEVRDIPLLTCLRAEVKNSSELGMEHLEQSEETIADLAKYIGAKSPQNILDAIRVLENAGLHDLASDLSEWHIAGKVHTFLKDNV